MKDWDKKLNLRGLEKQHGLPDNLLSAVMQVESAGNPKAVSPKGAAGLFQFMPATAKEYNVDPYSPESSASGAARKYQNLLKKYDGDVDKALAAYNWGQGNVDRKGLEKMPAETVAYIQKVKSKMGNLQPTTIAFDPDAYIASKSTVGNKSSSSVSGPIAFDPDAYIASRTPKQIEKPQWGKDNPTLYKVAKGARDLLGPTVEALGAGLGGVAGAAAGTVASPTVVINPVTGAVAGSALGYGAAKSALDIADELLGLKEKPKDVVDTLKRGAENIATGAMYEMGGQMAGKALQKGVELAAKGVTKAAGIGDAVNSTQKAAKLAKAAAGNKLSEVRNALAQAPEGLTASQALANQIDPATGKAVLNVPEMQAMLKNVEATKPTEFSDILRSQEVANVNALSQLAGGISQTQSKGTQQAAKNALREVTDPMREQALQAANIAGQKLPALRQQEARFAQAAANKVEDVRRFTAAGERAKNSAIGYTGELSKKADEVVNQAADASLKFGEASRFAKAAADSLEAHGLKPLEFKPLVQKISELSKNQSFAGNDIVEGAIKNITEDLTKWSSNGGIIDAFALDAIRKNSINAAVEKLRPGMDQTAQKNLASSILSKIKPIIDDAIETSGGIGYKEYLDTYAKGMEKINQTKLGAEALKLYQSSPQKFVDLVEGNSPKVIEKIFGSGNYDLAKAMGDDAAKRLAAIGNQIRAVDDIARQATAGQKEFDKLLKDHFFKLEFPGMLNIAATATNKILDVLSGKIEKKTMETLVNAAKNAKTFDELLKTLPISERNSVLKIINNPKTYETLVKGAEKIAPKAIRGGVISGVNSYRETNERNNKLAPDSPSKNYLLE